MQTIRVTQGLSPYSPFGKEDSPIPPWAVKAASDRGTRSHNCFSAYALNLYCKPDDDISGYFESFKKWFDRYVLRVLLVEERLTSKVYNLSGELDFLFELEGITKELCIAVVDAKTPPSKSRLWDGQLAAYWFLAEHETQFKKVDRAGALRLDRDGGIAKMSWVDNLPLEWNYYLCGITAYRHYVLGE